MSAPTFFDGSGNIPVPINSLTAVGLQAETVKQLSDMKQYLAVNFGLEMSISAIPGLLAHNLIQGQGQGRGFDTNQGGKYRPNPEDVQFMISKESAGGIIGKGGYSLKELQLEFGLKIYIEREIIDGASRNVILSGGDASTRSLCQERIVEMSQNPIYFQPLPTNNESNHMDNDMGNDMSNDMSNDNEMISSNDMNNDYEN